MEADSTEDALSPPPKIYLSTSLPGSSVPIRAPLTIDSDSEFFLCNDDQNCSRSSSFNSSSSIEISSYGDEHTSVHDDEDVTFLAYPNEKISIETCRIKEYAFTTPFVKYPDRNYVKDHSNFDDSAIFRPVVKTSCEESSTVADFPIKLGVPVAPLTSDCDSDIDSVDVGLWLDSGEIPTDEVSQKVTMSPKVQTSSGDEAEDELIKESQIEGMSSDDSINSIHELSTATKDSALAEPIEDEEHKVDCLNVVDSQEIDAEVLSNSDHDIKIESISDYKNESIEKEEESLAETQPLKSKFLKLIHLLGLSNKDSNVMHLLHRPFLEDNEFDSNLTILTIGKTGVGKTATINSIFGETKAKTDPFGPGTTSVQEIVGNIDGVHLRIIDTPGLKCCSSDRAHNLRVLSNVKKSIQKHTPDVVLYVDRLDMYTRDVIDTHLLRLISSSLGSSVWRNCIIALTHAASNGHESLGEFVLPRCRFIQEQIVRFGGNDWGMGNLVWLVENHVGYKREINWRNRLIANEDECGHVALLEPFLERKKVYLKGDGYRVKLLGTKNWSLACRLYS